MVSGCPDHCFSSTGRRLWMSPIPDMVDAELQPAGCKEDAYLGLLLKRSVPFTQNPANLKKSRSPSEILLSSRFQNPDTLARVRATAWAFALCFAAITVLCWRYFFSHPSFSQP